MHIVIGSGPAGVACAKALLDRGVAVRMLDAGLTLEPEREATVRAMGAVPPSRWAPEQVARLKEGMQSSAKGIPLKRIYGSDFPYREADEHVPASYTGVGLRPSLALGGFSNVWGAAMLPYAEADLDGWPVKTTDLAPHYRAVLRFTGLAAGRDGLEEFLPLHFDEPGALPLSRQAQLLLGKLDRHRPALQEEGFAFGRSRLAVQTAQNGRAGCVACGLCMYGCPYGYIYNSAATVRALQGQAGFTYQHDLVVTTVQETASGVTVTGFDRETHTPFSIEADRVYLAAGVIPTTRILLQSLGAYDHPRAGRDSQYFLFPLLFAQRTRGVQTEELHTLSQLFLEIRNPRVNQHTMHLQVYSYNDLVGQAVRRSFGPLARPLEWLARQLEERMLIVQGYLHSDDSALLQMTLRRGAAGAADRLEVSAEPQPQTRPAIRRVLRAVARQARQLGAVPLTPMLQVAEPGRGFHSGGTFPMRERPAEFETDSLGRPHGWSRIHAVDATVFPSIPATTITLSVMANAHRIGWETAALS